MILCHCGDCPADIPRAIDFDYWCVHCAHTRGIYSKRWEDEIELGFNYCTGCDKHGFVAVVLKEV
jgi:hypothetical protein